MVYMNITPEREFTERENCPYVGKPFCPKKCDGCIHYENYILGMRILEEQRETPFNTIKNLENIRMTK